MKSSFALVLWFSLVLISCTAQKPETKPFQPMQEKISEVVPRESSKDPTISTRLYTTSDVSMHSAKDDCWLIIDGGVYDVTSFIPSHPGGDKILRGCGKDATQMFAKHPESARALKKQFKIGEISQ